MSNDKLSPNIEKLIEEMAEGFFSFQGRVFDDPDIGNLYDLAAASTKVGFITGARYGFRLGINTAAERCDRESDALRNSQLVTASRVASSLAFWIRTLAALPKERE